MPKLEILSIRSHFASWLVVVFFNKQKPVVAAPFDQGLAQDLSNLSWTICLSMLKHKLEGDFRRELSSLHKKENISDKH